MKKRKSLLDGSREAWEGWKSKLVCKDLLCMGGKSMPLPGIKEDKWKGSE